MIVDLEQGFPVSQTVHLDHTDIKANGLCTTSTYCFTADAADAADSL